MATAMKHMASNFAKIEKLEGVDFRRWHKKMHLLLSSMSMVYVLTTPIPEDGGDNPTVDQNVKTSKELWDTLEAKYMAEDASSKKFTQHKKNMDESIQVSGIIDKLPPSWKDFKHTLKHLKEELTLVELGSHLCIKESLRVQDNDKPKGNNVVGPSVVNMVEHNNSSRYNDNKGKCKHHDKKVDPNKKQKVTCWKCGKPGQLKKDCKAGNVGNKANGSSTKGLGDGSSNSLKGQNMFNKSLQVYYVTYVSKAYFVQDDDVVWAVVRLPNPKLKTLDERGIECIFVGYVEHCKDFRFYVIEPNDSVSFNSIIKSKDAIFDENRFSSVPRPSLRIPNGTEDIGGSEVPEKVTKEVVQQPKPELRKSKRYRTPKDFGHEF
ncbi:zinc finger, CCHC-type containing protein [Tanacetum coccineum]